MPRDRDESGRPRNARPRDGLGRPLAYDAEQPDATLSAGPGPRRSPEQALREAQRLLDAGRPFHAHEVLEDAWKGAPAAERGLWRGLAQLAVGLTHAARGNPVGANALLRRGASNLEPYRTEPPYALDVAGLLAWALEAADAISSGSARTPGRSCPSLSPPGDTAP
ncbi:MAG TPA: DUF309 domain-containing protein [Mycobacteriales bacterium]|nr:DUF309 domain-containing protein [Mycobacteriales bacterium]